MRAAILTAAGGPEVIEVRDVADPVPSAREVLVRVRATALNRADLLQRQGRYPAPPGYSSDIGGIEFAGVVVGAGPAVTRWSPGTPVLGITGGGAHAEYVVVHEDAVAPIPEGLSWEAAGAVPEAFMTAHDALVTQARLRPGELVLIHAVASGVGLAAVHLARALGARTFGTTRQPDKLARAIAQGLDAGHVPGDDLASLADVVRAASSGRGAEVTLDLVGGPYVAASIAASAPRGRVMIVGAVGGAQASIDIRQVLGKRLTLQGTVLRSRPHEEKVQVTEAFTRDVAPWLATGTVSPVIDQVFPLEAIAEAHRRLESNTTFGKVVILIP